MDFNDLPPEERKRMLAALEQDSRYARSRHVLLLVSLVVTLCLAGIGWLVMKGAITMWLSVAVIAICVATYLYFVFRTVRIKKATLGRWLAQGAARKMQKKEKKDKKKGGQN